MHHNDKDNCKLEEVWKIAFNILSENFVILSPLSSVLFELFFFSLGWYYGTVAFTPTILPTFSHWSITDTSLSQEFRV